MSTSQKHRNFTSEPMGEKLVTKLAGIASALGNRLKESGFDKAYVVLGQFFVLKKDEKLFKDWLKKTCGADAKQQGECHACLVEWCNNFLTMSTSQKHRNFTSEPMGEKLVTELAGIGPILGNRLKESGFDNAYVVLGQFLVLKKDEELFKDWLKETCGANAKQQGDCHACLVEWCNHFL